MNLEQALQQSNNIETTFPTNLEKGWIELSIKWDGENYFVNVVYDITESGLTMKTTSLDNVKVFLEEEQGIMPDDNVWIKQYREE